MALTESSICRLSTPRDFFVEPLGFNQVGDEPLEFNQVGDEPLEFIEWETSPSSLPEWETSTLSLAEWETSPSSLPEWETSTLSLLEWEMSEVSPFHGEPWPAWNLPGDTDPTLYYLQPHSLDSTPLTLDLDFRNADEALTVSGANEYTKDLSAHAWGSASVTDRVFDNCPLPSTSWHTANISLGQKPVDCCPWLQSRDVHDSEDVPPAIMKRGQRPVVPDPYALSHASRPLKPYQCPSTGCRSRFLHHADLYRHQRTVHMRQETGEGYRCAFEGCPKIDKIWARLDSFRKHVSKKHKQANVRDILEQSSRSRYEAGNQLPFAVITPSIIAKKNCT